jgi:hypothetical protein
VPVDGGRGPLPPSWFLPLPAMGARASVNRLPL